MGRTKDQNLVERDERIVEMIGEGFSRQQVADTMGVTTARISQILGARDVIASPEEYRVEQMIRLKWIQENKLYGIIKGKGKRLVANGNGQKINDDDGTPLYDEGLILDAVDRYLRIDAHLAKLLALDIQRLKEREDPQDVTEMFTWVREIGEENRGLRDKITELESQLGVQEGTVDAEIVED